MTKRFATPDDIETFVRVRFDYFTSVGWKAADDLKERMDAQLRAYYPAHLNKDFFVAFAEIDGAVVSVAFLTVNEMPANMFAPTGIYGTILNVLTYPEHRRKGCASKVLELLITKAKEENLSFIQLSASDMGKSVYEKLGFKPEEKQGSTNMRLSLV